MNGVVINADKSRAQGCILTSSVHKREVGSTMSYQPPMAELNQGKDGPWLQSLYGNETCGGLSDP